MISIFDEGFHGLFLVILPLNLRILVDCPGEGV